MSSASSTTFSYHVSGMFKMRDHWMLIRVKWTLIFNHLRYKGNQNNTLTCNLHIHIYLHPNHFFAFQSWGLSLPQLLFTSWLSFDRNPEFPFQYLSTFLPKAWDVFWVRPIPLRHSCPTNKFGPWLRGRVFIHCRSAYRCNYGGDNISYLGLQSWGSPLKSKLLIFNH